MTDDCTNGCGGHAVPCHLIEPNGVYSLGQARAALGLKESTVKREIRLGRLRSSKRAGRRWIRGTWLMEWIESGEEVRTRPAGEPRRGELTAAATPGNGKTPATVFP